MITIEGSAVLRDGDEIGEIAGNACALSKPVGPVIKSQIRKAAKNDQLVFSEAKAAKAPAAKPKPTPAVVKPADEEKPLEAPEVFNDGKHRVGIERLFHFVKFGKLEAPPPTHPGMGKVTPVFVEWARKHLDDDEFDREYGSRKLPTLAEFERADKEQRDPFRKLQFRDGITTETADTEA
jgi:hypothetical protein